MPGEKTLLVMRHAKSSWKTPEPDHDRPLSNRGTRDAVAAGDVLGRHTLDLVWCSAATRATQTWECALVGGASCPQVRHEEALYEAGAAELLTILHTTPAEVEVALLIAHEPAVSDLVVSLTAASPLRARLEEKFPTSAVAALRFTGAWSELRPDGADLVAFDVPRG